MPDSPALVRYSAVHGAFQSNPDAVMDAVHKGASAVAKGDSSIQSGLVADWNSAMSGWSKEDKGAPVMSSPRNALASRIQSQLSAKGAETGQVQTVQPATVVHTDAGDFESNAVVEVKFSDLDLIGWLGMSWELIFKPQKAAWIPPLTVPEPVPNNATIALFGDWGTGLYGAPVIAQSIAKMSRCDVVIHMGDTYYSGAPDETYKRLVGEWPKRDGAINRSLNGNHEMYSGGQGYFAALQNFFKQPASCFAMQNDRWILVGLDTAYVDGDLAQSQVDWLTAIVNAAGRRKLILLSHHQPFSQLDDPAHILQTRLGALLNKQRIYAWFWGHEHRLLLYEPHRTWGFKGRCIGHGGFPAVRDDLPGIGGKIYQWLQLTEQAFAPAVRMLDGPNFWVTQDPMGYSPHGFATLEFDGDNCFETYRTADGIAVTGRVLL